MYVLVVENEIPLQVQMRAVLEGSAVPISFASDPYEAIQIVTQVGAPVVLVTNLDLGRRLDGYGLAHEIRRKSPAMPTLFVSATRWDVVRGIVSKQDFFLLKPFDAAAFAGKLREIVQQALAPSSQSRRA